MTFNEEQVEWIVREVLRRLGVIQAEQSPGAGGTLRVTARVITMKVIEGRLAGVNCVVVPKRAVVTPAVKDELNSRKIKLTIEGTEH